MTRAFSFVVGFLIANAIRLGARNWVKVLTGCDPLKRKSHGR